MTRFLMTIFFYHAGHLPVYNFDSFMIATLALGGSWPLYRGVYIVGERGHEVYFPTWVAA
jgi:hypothetical protein